MKAIDYCLKEIDTGDGREYDSIFKTAEGLSELKDGSLSNKQRELILKWVTDEKFYWGVIGDSSRNVLKDIFINNNYNDTDAIIMNNIRKKWIEYLVL